MWWSGYSWLGDVEEKKCNKVWRWPAQSCIIETVHGLAVKHPHYKHKCPSLACQMISFQQCLPGVILPSVRMRQPSNSRYEGCKSRWTVWRQGLKWWLVYWLPRPYRALNNGILTKHKVGYCVTEPEGAHSQLVSLHGVLVKHTSLHLKGTPTSASPSPFKLD